MEKYIIKQNDTLETIAKEHNMDIKELIEINKIEDRKRLGIGNIIKVKAKEKRSKNG